MQADMGAGDWRGSGIVSDVDDRRRVQQQPEPIILEIGG
jgi:hypothetical protein